MLRFNKEFVWSLSRFWHGDSKIPEIYWVIRASWWTLKELQKGGWSPERPTRGLKELLARPTSREMRGNWVQTQGQGFNPSCLSKEAPVKAWVQKLSGASWLIEKKKKKKMMCQNGDVAWLHRKRAWKFCTQDLPRLLEFPSWLSG